MVGILDTLVALFYNYLNKSLVNISRGASKVISTPSDVSVPQISGYQIWSR